MGNKFIFIVSIFKITQLLRYGGGICLVFGARYSSGTSLSGGTTITAIKHDTDNSNLPAQIVLKTGGTGSPAISDSEKFIQAAIANEEISTTLTMQSMRVFPIFAEIFNIGYSTPTIESIIIRENESFVLQAGTTRNICWKLRYFN